MQARFCILKLYGKNCVAATELCVFRCVALGLRTFLLRGMKYEGMVKMRKVLSVLLAVCLLLGCLPLPAFAIVEDSGSYGENATWELDGDGTLTINGMGYLSIGGLGAETNNKVKHLVIGEGFTSFSSALTAFTNLESVDLPNTLTSLGARAFSGCAKLKSVVIPNSVTSLNWGAFSNCTSLESVILSNKITEIPDGFFSGCISLTDLPNLDHVDTINSSAFEGCTGLTSVTIPENVVTIEKDAFRNCTGLTDVTLCGIGNVDGVFSGCTALSSVTIQGAVSVGGFSKLPGLRTVNLSAGVTTIENKAFCQCPNLAGIALPEGVTDIGARAFEGCESLVDVTLPDSLTTIGFRAFGDCKSLSGIILPDSVTSVGEQAFSGCGSLASIRLSNSLTDIPEACFSGCSSLQSVTLPESVTSLGEWAFNVCSSLTSVEFSNNLTAIPEACFRDCANLQSVTLPEGVTALGNDAFLGCRNLKNLYLPDSLTTISRGCFSKCSALEYLRLPNIPASQISNGFYSLKNMKTIEFAGSIEEFAPLRNIFAKIGVPLSSIDIAYMGEPGGYQFIMTLDPGEGVLSGENHITVKKGTSCGELPVPMHPAGRTFLGWFTAPDGGEIFLSNTEISRSGDFTLYAHWTSGLSALKPVAEGAGPVNLIDCERPQGELSHNYRIRGRCLRRALYENAEGGLTKVEWGKEPKAEERDKGMVYVEEFDSNNVLRGQLTLPMELPVWGGFFSGSRFNFIIFGQENLAESDRNEVVRVVRYDKQWNRIDHCSLYGKNTQIPFKSTSLRCTESGDYLIVHTAHQMYVSPDGKNHQANFTFTVNQYSMKLGTSRYLVEGPGYVSHSFNQFVLINQEGRIVTLDHGDAYPRSIVMHEYTGSKPNQGVLGKSEKAVTVETLPGEIGENSTGASVGGFAETSGGYVAAFNMDRDKLYGDSRNVYLAFVDKSTYSVKQAQLTTTKDCHTPILAPFGLDGGYVMWTRRGNSGMIYYAWYSANGSVGEVQQAEGNLSDCQPILHDGKATWCVRTGEKYDTLTFYTLNRTGQLTSRSMQTRPEDTPPTVTPTTTPTATPTPTPTPTPDTPSFTDVPAGEYYTEPVAWAVEKGITSGTGNGKFSPNAACTREQIVTFLWRNAGEPEPATTANPFSDVKPSDYAYKAILWAVENNITSGTGQGKFSPKNPCKRSEAVTFMWRAADKPESTGSAFSDVPAGAFYEKAVAWAVANGITSGTGKNKFSPGSTCTRGQIVTFLYRNRADQ